MSKYEKELQLAQRFVDAVNNMSFNKEAFADEILRQHRTLQQSTFGVFLVVIAKWAEVEHFDLRNEFTIEKSREIVKALGKYNLKVPFI
jgi:hypothetical protein